VNPLKMLGFGQKGKEAVSVINNPFGEKNISDIWIQYTTWGSKRYWVANVKFRNGNTQAEQRTPETATFEEVIVKLKEIFESVKTYQ
jgi:hypothetical protein